jgi:MFS transporter, putative metabolite:H+ symporter
MMVSSILTSDLAAQEWGLDDFAFSALSSTVFAGLLVGNLLGGFLADSLGRRTTMIGVNVVFCVFGVLSAIAPDIWVFAISRFFTGIGVGSMVPVSDTHLLEWSPRDWRGKLAMLLTGVAFAIGAAFACIAGIEVSTYGGEEWWRWMLLVCIIPGLVALPFFILYLPESPHWLLVHDRVEECEEKLRELAEANGVEVLAGGKVAKIERKVEQEGWDPLEILGPELRATTLYCTIAWVVCGFVYYGHIFMYPVLLEDVYDLKITEAYSTILIGTLGEVCVVVSMMFIMDIEGIGRRGAMAIGFAITWLCAAFAPLAQDLTQFIILNSLIKGLIEGPFTVIYIYAGELFPSTHRGIAVSFCNSFGRIAAMIAPITLMSCYHVSPFTVFLALSSMAFVGLAATFFFYRETLGRDLIMFASDIKSEEELPLIPLLKPSKRRDAAAK